jgi:hypothetical protein
MANTYVNSFRNMVRSRSESMLTGKCLALGKRSMRAYAKVSGTFGKKYLSAFKATSFVTLSSGSGTFTVPDGANAIHIQYCGRWWRWCNAGGADYDKAGGESAGAGGGSGSYISDKIFTCH